ncbi:replication protein, partial [Ectobacillus funiculus]
MRLDNQSKEEKVTLELSKEEFKKLQRLLEMQGEKQEEEKKRAEEDKNANFVQLYREHMPEMRWLMTNHPFP